jgi:dihydrofolate synthase/folylpolyglutamate synthase
MAGTNGKGSTSAIIASILQTAGFTVGLFTSPHLVSFTERIRVNGNEISESEVVRLAGEIKDISLHIDDFSPTFFEVVTAMALLYFAGKKINIAVMEVGMGGRLDATNIILPEVSVITSIGYDHKEFLGISLGEIAFEKAGIIKNGVPVVVSHQETEVKKVIEKKARENNADFYMYRTGFLLCPRKGGYMGIWFDYRDGGSVRLDDLFLPLAGEHQMQNASVAIKTAMIVLVTIMSILDCPHLSDGPQG